MHLEYQNDILETKYQGEREYCTGWVSE